MNQSTEYDFREEELSPEDVEMIIHFNYLKEAIPTFKHQDKNVKDFICEVDPLGF